jgi:glycosyltransferase involved in cell wall biosynthesis
MFYRAAELYLVIIMTYKPCVIIPVYNHGDTMANTLAELDSLQLPCIVVDDGSDAPTKDLLAQLNDQYDFVTLITRNKNGGKGTAVLQGIHQAKGLGYSHAVQVDADGQHNLADIPALLSVSEQQPEALVSGWPQYDNSIPTLRLYGRYITHFWVWVETLSLSIKDSMCGFRVYPVAQTTHLLERNKVGLRMDFDTDIMVRLYWQGTPSLFMRTHIIYPQAGISHFAVFDDNVRISWMHTRLVAGMLLRLPQLLWAKIYNDGAGR